MSGLPPHATTRAATITTTRPSSSRRSTSTTTTNSTANGSTTTTSNSSNNNTIVVTAQDLQNLQHEIKALQQMIQQGRSQVYHVESLTRSVSARTVALERRLDEINSHVIKIGGLEKVVTSVRDFLHQNPAVKGLLDNLENLLGMSRPYVVNYKRYILSILIIVGVAWKYGANMFYQSASEEVADLAKRTLEQQSLRTSIQETLHTVANNPQTLETLNALVQKLITHEQTKQELVQLLVFAVSTPDVQTALLDLLQVVFQDPKLQELAGEFLLKGLDIENVKAMLDAQTAQLVRDTVSDDSVQQATAVGLQRSLWYAVTPSFLWRFMEKGKEKHGSEEVSNVKDENSKLKSKQGDHHRSVEDERVAHENLPSQ